MPVGSRGLRPLQLLLNFRNILLRTRPCGDRLDHAKMHVGVEEKEEVCHEVGRCGVLRLPGHVLVRLLFCSVYFGLFVNLDSFADPEILDIDSVNLQSVFNRSSRITFPYDTPITGSKNFSKNHLEVRHVSIRGHNS